VFLFHQSNLRGACAAIVFPQASAREAKRQSEGKRLLSLVESL
jgi:hypothetical protein